MMRKRLSVFYLDLLLNKRNIFQLQWECLSVIWAVEKLRHYIKGTHFTVVTDHASLIWLNKLKDPTGRLARWAVCLQPFYYTIIYRKNKENVVPDSLTRSAPIAVDSVTTNSEHSILIGDSWYFNMINNVNYIRGNSPNGVWKMVNYINMLSANIRNYPMLTLVLGRKLFLNLKEINLFLLFIFLPLDI